MSDFHMKGTLQCGIEVEVIQPGDSQVVEFTFTAPTGAKIEDTAWFQDGKLRINATVSAVMGMREFFGLMFGQQARKTWLQRLLNQ
jgi:hypothetical protein